MAIVNSLVYGYAGAVLAGLLVSLVGVALGLSEEAVVAVATPTGVVLGTLGIGLGWRRAHLARVRRD